MLTLKFHVMLMSSAAIPEAEIDGSVKLVATSRSVAFSAKSLRSGVSFLCPLLFPLGFLLPPFSLNFILLRDKVLGRMSVSSRALVRSENGMLLVK